MVLFRFSAKASEGLYRNNRARSAWDDRDAGETQCRQVRHKSPPSLVLYPIYAQYLRHCLPCVPLPHGLCPPLRLSRSYRDFRRGLAMANENVTLRRTSRRKFDERAHTGSAKGTASVRRTHVRRFGIPPCACLAASRRPFRNAPQRHPRPLIPREARSGFGGDRSERLKKLKNRPRLRLCAEKCVTSRRNARGRVWRREPSPTHA